MEMEVMQSLWHPSVVARDELHPSAAVEVCLLGKGGDVYA